jgi:predicted transcriptional regulator
MDALKEATIETIRKLPDGCTTEDIMYEIDFIGNVFDGLKDADAGRTITTEELLVKAASWAR